MGFAQVHVSGRGGIFHHPVGPQALYPLTGLFFECHQIFRHMTVDQRDQGLPDMPNLGRMPRADWHLRNGGCRCHSQAVRQPWFADPRRQPVHPEGRIRRRLSPKIGTDRVAELMAVTQPTVQPAMGCDVQKVRHRRSFLGAFRSRQRMPSGPTLNRRNHCRAGILRKGLGF